MGENSAIEWTDHTFNPWIGCSKVSPGCANCYAESLMETRYGKVQWGPNGTRVVTSEANWKKPLKWDREANAAGVRARVFCASLADVFEDWQGPIGNGGCCESIGEIREHLFQLIDRTPNLDWLLLTKRPENIWRMWPMTPGIPATLVDTNGQAAGYKKWDRTTQLMLRPNVWLLTSVENQEQADRRIPELLKCRDLSPVLGLSCEPLLWAVDLTYISNRSEYRDALGGLHASHYAHFQTVGPTLDWVIVGGESGPNARPMHPQWARSLRDQCTAAGVPYFFKQWGEYGPDQIGNVRFTPVSSGVPMSEPASMFRVGKKAAGRLLDGREWSEFPEVIFK